MTLPYYEDKFRELKAKLNDKACDKVRYAVREVFIESSSSKQTIGELIKAIVRVAYKKGYPVYTIIGGQDLWSQEFIFYRNFKAIKKDGKI